MWCGVVGQSCLLKGALSLFSSAEAQAAKQPFLNDMQQNHILAEHTQEPSPECVLREREIERESRSLNVKEKGPVNITRVLP